MTSKAFKMVDQNLLFLEKFIRIYEGLVAHDGYGDMEISVRLGQGRKKEIRLRCGREYCFTVPCPRKDEGLANYKIVSIANPKSEHLGLDRRCVKGRRNGQSRRCMDLPRNFKLERRINSERRSGHSRRHNLRHDV